MDYSVYEFPTKCYGYDSDRYDRIKLSSILKGLQTVAGMHLDAFGLTFDYMTQNKSIFVMVKASVNIFRTPRREECLTYVTWTTRVDGLVFVRETVAKDKDGRVLLEASVNWILVDPDAHGILRPDALNYNIEFHPELALTGTRTGRLRTPKEMDYVGSHTVQFTDCDFIGHMNNTNYADIVANVLPEVKAGKNVAKFDIVYSLEAKEGEEITLCRKDEIKDGDKVIFIRGEHPRGKCFEAMVVLDEE